MGRVVHIRCASMLTLLFAVVLMTSACGNLVNQIVDEAKNAAFDEVLQEAQREGGAAVRIQAGKPARLEVLDASSPIRGTFVDIPGGAIPDGVKDGALLVKHMKDFRLPQFSVVGFGGEPTRSAGPTVMIDLRIFEGPDVQQLSQPAIVGLPFANDVSASVQSRLAILHAPINKPFEILRAGKVDPSARIVTSTTISFSPFVAVVQGQAGLVTVPNQLSVKVVKSGTTCEQTVTINASTASVATAYRGDYPNPQFSLSLRPSNDAYFTLVAYTQQNRLQPQANFDYSDDIATFEPSVTCVRDGQVYSLYAANLSRVNHPKFSLRLVSFSPQGDPICQQGVCSNHGQVMWAVTFEFADASGNMASVASQFSQQDALWWYQQ